jgi:flagella basal body P-ring formation protein FlgA
MLVASAPQAGATQPAPARQDPAWQNPAWQNLGALSALAQQYVESTIRDPGGRLQVTVVPPDPRLRLPACASPLAETAEGQRLWAWTQVRVRCAGEGGWSLNLRVRVQVFAPAVLARRALPPGHVVEAEDMQVAEADIVSAQRPPLRDAAQVVGKLLRIGVAAGQPLMAEHLKLPIVVRRGAPVEVTATVGQVSVTGSGTAQQDGAVGDLVRIKVPGGRILEATVTGDGRVSVQSQ